MLSELYFKSFHNSPVAKAVSTYDTGFFIEVNESFCKLTRYKREEIIGKKSIELNLFPNYERKKMIDIIVEKGFVKNEELEIRESTGQIKNGLFSAEIVHIEDKKCLLSVFVDVSEKKKLTEELIESEMKFRNIFNESPIGIALYGNDGELHEINESCLEVFGIKSIDDIKHINLFHQKNSEKIKEILQKESYYEEIIKINFDSIKIIKSKRKGIYHFKMIITKYKFNGSSYMAMIQDVTDTFLQTIDIKESEEKFRSIFYKSPIGIELYNENGILQEINEEIIKIFGIVNIEELKKFNLFEDPNLPENIKEILDREEKWESDIEFDFDIITKKKLYKTSKKGKVFLHIIITKQNILKNEKYIVQVQDITETVNRNKKLKDLNDTKDRFFSIVSHDLKNPFTSIIGFTDILYEDYQNSTDNERLEYIKNIKDAAKNAYDLLENLLDWSISQSDKINYDPKNIDLSNPINDTIKLLKQQSLIKNIKITSKVMYNTHCYADINMLKTILRNLVSNAIKFTNNDGEIKISSETLIHKGKRYIRINVTDNGIGIKKENINKLFKPEFKFKMIGTNKEKGAGLGLVICKEFIDIMGGKIFVESEEGKGSTFSFTIPESE